MKRGPIVLATDFGSAAYVGQMKGVIAGIAPDAKIIDLMHDIAPQDILEGLWHLRGALPFFPAGTIFVAVVDPGVGTQRRAICVDGGDVLAVGPDNGILTFIPPENRRSIRLITSQAHTLQKKSHVFHGRDIFAPAAAHLALGLDPAALGPDCEGMIELPWARPRRTPAGIEGSVLSIDRFGNLLTNIEGDTLPPEPRIHVESQLIGALHRTYSDVPPGKLVALVGSSGFLEIAQRNGSAAKALGAAKGAKVIVKA